MASILLIDDEAPIQLLLKRIVGHGGNEVATACDASGAFELLKSRSFDVVFTDLTLPGGPPPAELLGGISVLARGSTVVVVSGQLPQDVQSLCDSLGICRFLAKPFDVMSVRAMLADILAERAKGGG